MVKTVDKAHYFIISLVILTLALLSTSCMQEYDMFYIPELDGNNGQDDVWTVTFDSNGGSAVPSQAIPKDGVSTATYPDNPEKLGFGFVDWHSDPDLSSPYDFDTPITSDITLYAEWSETFYDVTFNSNGGSSVAVEEVGHGGKASLPHSTRTNYVLEGWYKEAGLINKWDFAHDVVTSDVTLHAKWLGDLTTATITITGNYTYTGSAQTPTFTVEHDGTALTANTHFTAAYTNNTNAGTATVTITAATNSNYTGTVQKTFTISPKVINPLSINAIQNQTYTGSALTPVINVVDGPNELILNTDYTRTYTNNTNAGTATVTVTGAGNYAGSSGTATFIIEQAAGATITAVPTVASVTDSSITINAITKPANQVVEYAIATSTTAPTNASDWQTGLTFIDLSAGSTYYVFARSQENGNYLAGTASVSAAIVAVSLSSGGSFKIEIAQIMNPDPNLILDSNVVLSHSGGDSGAKTATVTLNTGSYTIDDVKWYVGSVELTDLGANFYTLNLDVTNTNYNTIGMHYLTVEVQINGLWYSKQFKFEVKL